MEHREPVSRFFVTPHAVERFRARWAPALSYGHARRELSVLCDRARRLHRPDPKGEGELYEIGDRDKIIIVVQQRRVGKAVVTVLPMNAHEAEPGGDLEPE